MKRLHERVLRQELELLKLKHPAYPDFAIKVLEGLGFVDRPPGDVFYLQFDGIFNMLNMKWPHRIMVRLPLLSLANQVTREKTPSITILDPYFMVQSTFTSPEGQTLMMELLQSFFTVNKEKIIFSCLTLPSK
jgi:hypothetical protein